MFIIGRIALYKYGSRAGGQAGAGGREGRRGGRPCVACAGSPKSRGDGGGDAARFAQKERATRI